MSRRLARWTGIGLLVLGVACDHPEPAGSSARPASDAPVPRDEIGKPLLSVRVDRGSGPVASVHPASMPIDPIVVPNCQLTVVDRQEVPSRRDGILTAIYVKENDAVKPGQLLAQLDDQLAREDLAIKAGRILVAQAELAAAEKARDHFKAQHELLIQLHGGTVNAASQEEVRVAKLNYDRYFYEAESRRQAVDQARLEWEEAKTLVTMHEIRATCAGAVKAVYKRPGEAVKSYDPVLVLRGLGRLRAEGLVEKQYLSRVSEGMSAWVEAAPEQGPVQTLVGHLQDITAVAVGKDRDRFLIVSASDDRTVRVWEQTAGRWQEYQVLRHPVPVRSVACGTASSTPVCLTGAADGRLRMWALNAKDVSAPREFAGGHQGAVNCVAFCPDGVHCASGGEDREICLWDVARGQVCYRFAPAHPGAVTWLRFVPGVGGACLRLLSAGRDGTLRAWDLGEQGARLAEVVEHRSGDLTTLDVSPDGRRVLFDQDRALRLLTLPAWQSDGAVHNPGGAVSFSPFALFSPDGQLVLTAGASEGRLQLWRAPTAAVRGYEVRQLLPGERATATCAAFAPDGSFAVSGTQEGRVFVWSAMPTGEKMEAVRTPARITLIERAIEAGARRVRIWAEFDNPGGRLIPGATVNLVIDPPGVR